jgi:hypothetical protein
VGAGSPKAGVVPPCLELIYQRLKSSSLSPYLIFLGLNVLSMPFMRGSLTNVKVLQHLNGLVG